MSKKVPEGCRRVKMECTLVVGADDFDNAKATHEALRKSCSFELRYSSFVRDVAAMKFTELEETHGKKKAPARKKK